MAQDDVAGQPRTPQVEVAVLQPHVLRYGTLVGDRKRRRLRLVQNGELADDDFHLAGGELGIDRLRRAPLHASLDPDDEFGAEPLPLVHQRLVVLVENDLRDAAAIAHVHEQQPAEIAHPVDPPEEHHVAADIGRTQRAARMSAGQIA
jgi:hypothetical protein